MNPLAALGAAQSTQSAASPAEAKPRPEVMKAAREFEAIFIRAMLAPLEKSTKLGSESQMAGQSAYGSMVVGAMADSLSSAGGIGMAEVIARAMTAQSAPRKTGG